MLWCFPNIFFDNFILGQRESDEWSKDKSSTICMNLRFATISFVLCHVLFYFWQNIVKDDIHRPNVIFVVHLLKWCASRLHVFQLAWRSPSILDSIIILLHVWFGMFHMWLPFFVMIVNWMVAIKAFLIHWAPPSLGGYLALEPLRPLLRYHVQHTYELEWRQCLLGSYILTIN